MRRPPLGFLLGLMAELPVLAAATSATPAEFDLPPGFEISVYSADRLAHERIRALEILVELHDAISPAAVKQLAASPDPGVVARLAWVLGRKPAVGRGQDGLAELTRHPSVLVQRASWEPLVGIPGRGTPPCRIGPGG